MSQARLLQYFEEELAYLSSAGARFARQHPERAALVSLDNVTSRDPDVERLVQAFAFLAGQVRAEQHDELPQITHALMELLWPHYLRPVPSTTVIEIKPDLNQLQNPFMLKPGEGHFESVPITSPETGRDFVCRFRNTFALEIMPIRVVSAEVVRQPTRSELHLKLEVGSNANPSISWKSLRFHLAGDSLLALEIRYWLLSKVDEAGIVAEIESPEGGKNRAVIGPMAPVGLLAAESLLEAGRLGFPGFRLVQEYLLARHKFQYVDLLGLDRIGPMEPGTRVKVRIPLTDHPPERLLLSADTLRLHCTPAINLFRSAAVPIRYDSRQVDYELIADHDVQAVAIQRIHSVIGQQTGSPTIHEYPRFLDFRRSPGSEEPYYHVAIQPGVDGKPVWRLSLNRPNGVVPPQIVSVDLECSNGELAAALLPGDIRFRGEGLPDLFEIRNLTQPEPLHHPPLESASTWRFISHLSMNYLTLEDNETLIGALKLYDWSASKANWRRLQGIRRLKAEAGCSLIEGIPLRGRDITLELDAAHFANIGDAYLFSEVLSHFFALYGHINSYVRLTCRLSTGAVFRWPALNGRQKPI